MMLRFEKGNLLASEAEALVNTVNTVGVMGKGIALMFKEKFPDNYRAYRQVCEAGQFEVGEVFATRRQALIGPKWIINFPTKRHWRGKTQLKWIEDGLASLKEFILENKISSVAIPPLGCGNGGLNWSDVKPIIVDSLSDLEGVDIIVFEPTREYQNVRKTVGVEKLTPTRAVVSEMIRRYSSISLDCSILEAQKICWLLESGAKFKSHSFDFNFNFTAGKYGPYSEVVRHMLDSLDGSYLVSEKRLSDAGPSDQIRFNSDKNQKISIYMKNHATDEAPELIDWVSDFICGFESPLGMEVLTTVDWLIRNRGVDFSVVGIKEGLESWPYSKEAGARKLALFDDRYIELALDQIERAYA